MRRRIQALVAPHWATIVQICLAALASALAALAITWLVAEATSAVASGSVDRLPRLAAFLGAALAVRAIATYGQLAASMRVATRAGFALRRQLIAATLASAAGTPARRPGEVHARALRDVSEVEGWLSGTVLPLLPHGFLSLALAIAALRASPLVALAGMGAVVVGLALLRRIRGSMHALYARAGEAYGTLSGSLHEAVDRIPIVQAFEAEQVVGDSVAAHAAELGARTELANRAHARSQAVIQLSLGALAVVAMLLLLAVSHVSPLTASEFASLLAALALVARPVQGLLHGSLGLSAGVSALGRIDAMLAGGDAACLPARAVVAGAGKPRGGDQSGNAGGGRLQLAGVGFAYGTTTVLDGVTLDIAAGEFVGIVGANGAGKSTLLQLCSGQLRPRAGQILLDGARVEAEPMCLRQATAWVPQEPALLTATVIENIALGDPEPDVERAEAALRDVGMWGRIARLPKGVESELEEGGREFSVGERQRLCIARALYRGAPLLLLDEPTASVDAESEAGIAELLGHLAGRRTVIVVSHRPEALRHAQRVVRLDAGSCVPAEARPVARPVARVLAS